VDSGEPVDLSRHAIGGWHSALAVVRSPVSRRESESVVSDRASGSPMYHCSLPRGRQTVERGEESRRVGDEDEHSAGEEREGVRGEK